MAPSPVSSSAQSPCASRSLNRIFWVGLFLLVLSSHLWLIAHFGNSTPFWDQWDGEAGKVLLPYQSGSLTVSQLVAPHNEHRIILTRLFSLALLSFNGNWDPKLEMVAQAILHSLTLAALVACCSSGIRPNLRPLLGLFAAIVFMIPFPWENILWGFQSQFYFVTLWGAAGLWCCWKFPTGSLLWSLGLLCFCLGLFSMASGLLAPAAASLLIAARVWYDGKSTGRQAIGLALLLILTVAGFLLVNHVKQHDSLKAANAMQAILALLTMASWPVPSAFAAFLLQAPIAWLAVVTFKNRRPPAHVAWLLLTLGFWIWLQMAAIAYGRGQGSLASRYTDIFLLSLFINFTILLHLYSNTSRKLRTLVIALSCPWGFIVALGLLPKILDDLPSQLADRRDLGRIQEANVKGFVATGDYSFLANKPRLHIPFPDAETLRTLLTDTRLRTILPTDLRPPLPSLQTTNADHAFQPNGHYTGMPGRPYDATWGSYSPQTGDRATGELQLHFGPATHGQWLKLSVAGYPASPGISLTLTDDQGHTRNIAPQRSPREKWKSVFFKAPDGPFSISAKDDNTTTWIAFSSPKVIGLGTLISGLLQSNAETLAALGLTLMGAGAIGLLVGEQRQPASQP
jgi:hypothetical protein